MSTSLENVTVDPPDLKRSIKINVRLHTIKGELNQVVQISTRIDTSVQ